MKPKVVLFHPVPSELLDQLNSLFDLTVFEKVTDSNRGQFLSAAMAADGLLGMVLPVQAKELRGAERLRVIVTMGAGYDRFDVPELTANKVLLMNVHDPLTETTADLAFALIMTVGRRIAEFDRKVRNGEWKKPIGPEWFGLDVHGKVLGIIGLGRIGAAIARRGALGCGMSILYSDSLPRPFAEKEYGARKCELDDLLAGSDYVCISVPLSPGTKHLIGERELKLMKPTGILVNASRGPIVDEAALAVALRNGTICAAGLDVYEKEPLPLDSPLLALDNVVLAPHIGSYTRETRDAMAMYAGETLINYLCRGETRNVVNPEAIG